MFFLSAFIIIDEVGLDVNILNSVIYSRGKLLIMRLIHDVDNTLFEFILNIGRILYGSSLDIISKI